VVGIGQVRFDIINRQFWICGKEVIQIRVIGKVRHDPLQGNARPFHNGLAAMMCGFVVTRSL
jgi:hypothetical protein